MRAQKRAGAIVHLPFVLRVGLLAAEPLCVAEVEPSGSTLEPAVAALHHVVLGQVIPLDHGTENIDVVRGSGVPYSLLSATFARSKKN